jgi:hypothetical protein
MKTNRKVVATIAAAVALTGLGVTAANATSAADAPATTAPTFMYLHEAFRETIGPWDAINIPSLSCPTGYLVGERLSEGRVVPKGVQVVEPGGIGVTISYVKSETIEDYWGETLHLVTGTDAERGHSTATNWDPFSSHELVINLACTTDLGDAARDPAYESKGS